VRPIYFVKSWDKGSTAIGADQMAEAIRALDLPGVSARSIYSRELHGIDRKGPIRDSVLVFIKRADFKDLFKARRRGNRCILDTQDQVVFRRWISHSFLYHGFIFRNRRQLEDFGNRRRALCRTIYQHWDPKYRPHEAGDDGLRLAYLGTRRSLSLWGEIPGVEFIGPDHWFDRAPGFNAHLAVRENRREWLYKPNAKVATAAACGAVLLTTPDCSSVEMLGEDYPFYLDGLEASRDSTRGADPETTRASVLRGIERARAEVGGPLWRDAVERMRALRADLTIERVARRYLEMFEELG
jgi:hypothetical protein